MKCRQCGSEIPIKSKFCLSCGSPVQQVEQPALAAIPHMRNPKIRMMAITAGLLVVLGIAYAMTALSNRARLLEAAQGGKSPRTSVVVGPTLRDSDGSNVLSASKPNDGGANVLSASKPDDGKGNVLNASKVESQDNSAPADVIAYLDHVKKIEAQRKDMRTDLSPAFEMLKKAYGVQYDSDDEVREKDQKEISGGISDYTQKWQKIVADFNAVKAPAGCDKLASAYGDALGRYSETMINIQTSLNKEDASALYKMYGNAQSDVDSALSKADDALADTCKNYGLEKSFSISTDEGVGSLLMPNVPSKSK